MFKLKILVFTFLRGTSNKHFVTDYILQHAFDYNVGEKFGCVADIGWITGHSYVLYGPLSNGGTTLLFESTPLYPDPGRYWEMVERLRLEHIYLAPTSLRMLLKAGDSYVTKYDRSSLKKLGCGKILFICVNFFGVLWLEH